MRFKLIAVVVLLFTVLLAFGCTQLQNSKVMPKDGNQLINDENQTTPGNHSLPGCPGEDFEKVEKFVGDYLTSEDIAFDEILNIALTGCNNDVATYTADFYLNNEKKGTITVSYTLESGLKVTKLELTNDSSTTEETVWLSIEPKQCGNNAWEKWLAESGVKFFAQPTQKQIINAYFKNELGIELLDFKQVQKYKTVCMACSCPRGDEIFVKVYSKDKSKLLELGWSEVSETEVPEQ